MDTLCNTSLDTLCNTVETPILQPLSCEYYYILLFFGSLHAVNSGGGGGVVSASAVSLATSQTRGLFSHTPLTASFTEDLCYSDIFMQVQLLLPSFISLLLSLFHLQSALSFHLFLTLCVLFTRGFLQYAVYTPHFYTHSLYAKVTYVCMQQKFWVYVCIYFKSSNTV